MNQVLSGQFLLGLPPPIWKLALCSQLIVFMRAWHKKQPAFPVPTARCGDIHPPSVTSRAFVEDHFMILVFEEDPVLQIVIDWTPRVISNSVHDAFQKAPNGLCHQLPSTAFSVLGGIVFEKTHGRQSVAVPSVTGELTQFFPHQAVWPCI